jgi:nucleotide-binding universal stress UspA family protein
MKILVPVDGSPYSLNAVAQACDLAKAQGAEVVLLAVSLELYDLGEGGHLVTDKLARQAEAALEQAKAKTQELGVAAQALLARSSSIAEEIVSVAKRENADLVIIGSRGLGAKTSLFLGGTASKVVHESPCSVLVVKKQD